MTISERNLCVPDFNRYPATITRAIERIATARGVIERARILPAQEELLRRDALVGSVHYSNLIEGNELSQLEATRAVEHALDRTTKAKIELVNYVAALEWIDEQPADGAIAYSPQFLKQLHRILTRGLGCLDSRFKPRHEGEWRDGDVRVEDAVTVYHVAPPPDKVDRLMRDRLEWLEHKRASSEYFDSVLAAIGHFEVAEVHPFADYNGRAARLFAVAILTRESPMAKRLFSPERFYAEGRDAYYAALRAIKTTRTLDAWLEYFVNGLASEFERVAETVEELNRVTGAVESTIQLSRHQQKIVAALTVGDRRDLSRAEAEGITGLEKTQTHSELSELVDAGLLRVRGGGNRTVYELSSRLRTRPENRPRRGPAGRWTEDRIRAELAALATDLGRMPKRSDFSAADQMGLYIAASKAGGIRRWAAELGYDTERETRNS